MNGSEHLMRASRCLARWVSFELTGAGPQSCSVYTPLPSTPRLSSWCLSIQSVLVSYQGFLSSPCFLQSHLCSPDSLPPADDLAACLGWQSLWTLVAFNAYLTPAACGQTWESRICRLLVYLCAWATCWSSGGYNPDMVQVDSAPSSPTPLYLSLALIGTQS